MTTGLDDATGNADDTSPRGPLYKGDAGTRWAYHNAPYTLLQKLVSHATGKTFNYFDAKLRSQIGMDGEWREGSSNVYWSTARSMARFGILMQAKALWNGVDILGDPAFLAAATNTSQNLNLSYGYLWWLNGRPSAMVPQSGVVLPVSLCSSAPPDMFAAMGKDGQLLNIVPSKGIIVIRMGGNADNTLVPFSFQASLWEKLNSIIR